MFSPFWVAVAIKSSDRRKREILKFLKKEGIPVAKAEPPEWYLKDWEKLEKFGIAYLDRVKREVAVDFVLENAKKLYPYWLRIKDCEWVKAYPVGSRWLIKCRHKNGKIKSLHNLGFPHEKLAVYRVLLGFKNSVAAELLEKLAKYFGGFEND